MEPELSTTYGLSAEFSFGDAHKLVVLYYKLMQKHTRPAPRKSCGPGTRPAYQTCPSQELWSRYKTSIPDLPLARAVVQVQDQHTRPAPRKSCGPGTRPAYQTCPSQELWSRYKTSIPDLPLARAVVQVQDQQKTAVCCTVLLLFLYTYTLYIYYPSLCKYFSIGDGVSLQQVAI